MLGISGITQRTFFFRTNLLILSRTPGKVLLHPLPLKVWLRQEQEVLVTGLVGSGIIS